MIPDRVAAEHPRAFLSETRCCTYYPDLPNFLIGRALGRGDVGSAAVKRQLMRSERVSAWGLEQPEDVLNPIGRHFGRDLSSRCPYFVGGEHTCGIWRDRDGVCRTWFCRYGEGKIGRDRWVALKYVLGWIETSLANICVETGAPPQGEQTVATWCDWFTWCAEHVEQITREQIDAARDEEISTRYDEWLNANSQTRGPIPDTLVPLVVRSDSTDTGITLDGYSSYDWVDVDGGALDLFVAMDGKRSWRDAAAMCEGEVETITAMIRELHRVDILKAPDKQPQAITPVDSLPDVLVPSSALPIVHAERVWIQGAPRLGSTLAPRSVFELLSRLDGETTWRDALASAQLVDSQLDEQLVVKLYQIGALAEA